MLDALIVGGDSRIARELILRMHLAGKNFAATSRRWPQMGDTGRLPFDLQYPSYLPKAELTFVCAGINGFKRCEENRDLAEKINVTLVGNLVCRLSAMGSKIVYLSSSVAETHPKTVYGGFKLKTEGLVLSLGGMCFRFGPVAFPGLDVWANDTYSPINVPTLMDALMSCFDDWRPGLHCLYNREWKKEAA